MLDNNQLFVVYNNDVLSFFKTLTRPLFVILLANVYVLTHKYNVIKLPVIVILTVFLLNSLYDDFIQFYSINQFYSNFS